ncbi:hypothetical protein L3N51_02460 [Metallosphaera sp. J1]|uniref:hypothetical protein n=1 Tax=Metallosphaera javensis (ex Hofmann et al. 2022) TaxID=99938 RepID=UPI001EDD1012|nr:hypothetical protein [Metallosphaera javensis (ex Hofmann et al. 2022)]MCG3110163.1 hypothetical protein [Metallosphaera javensis (ex Hofmann et al. 2022)]
MLYLGKGGELEHLENLMGEGNFTVPVPQGQNVSVMVTPLSSIFVFNQSSHYGNVEELYLWSSDQVSINTGGVHYPGLVTISGETSPFTEVNISVYGPGGVQVMREMTDSGGEYSAQLTVSTPGEYRVVVETSTGIENSTTFTVLPRLANVTIHVVNSRGSPVSGVEVQVGNESGTTNSSGMVVFSLPTGNYTVRLTPPYPYVEENRTISVVAPGDYTFTIALAVLNLSYRVEFNETGLPPGTEWYVNVSGIHYSRNSTICLLLPNGNYTFTVGAQGDYVAKEPVGHFTVNGSNLVVQVTFIPEVFPVIVKETGLPPGTEWYVNVSGMRTVPVLSSSFTLLLGAGNYTISVMAQGYTSNVTLLHLVVNSTRTILVLFSPLRANETQISGSNASGIGVENSTGEVRVNSTPITREVNVTVETQGQIRVNPVEIGIPVVALILVAIAVMMRRK